MSELAYRHSQIGMSAISSHQCDYSRVLHRYLGFVLTSNRSTNASMASLSPVKHVAEAMLVCAEVTNEGAAGQTTATKCNSRIAKMVDSC